MATQGEVNEIVKKIVDAAHSTGYYQALIEKCNLSDVEKQSYDTLNRKAIGLRINAIEELYRLLYPR